MSASVVKLPTAARRQVKQPCNKWSREAKKAMRDAQPVDFDFKFPTVREAEKIAKAIHPMTPPRNPATVWEVAIAAAAIGLVMFAMAVADLAARVLQ